MEQHEIVVQEIETEEISLVHEDTAAVVYCWRVEQLQRAGYSDELAFLMADDRSIDLHAACDLLARGCPEHTAYRILA
jgi:hypothetical protein